MRLPPFESGPKEWCRAIHRALRERCSHLRYAKTDRLSVKVRVYLPRARWNRIDVDNALKQVMDALQGAVGGEGKKGAREPVLIPEDAQIYRAEIAKTRTKKSMQGGYIVIQRLPGKHRRVGRRV